MIGVFRWWRDRKRKVIRANQEVQAALQDADHRIKETREIASAMRPDIITAREGYRRNHIYDAVRSTLKPGAAE